ncbi:sensor histidine kinase [Streptomyces avicenniae]|uniref:sensor histidine kinase n=1 Tax=Streptomyces avicenniae TaxID=500153 RepID=UPI00069AD781|nr:ATP-binding protein [Streptomyces avicenniae]
MTAHIPPARRWTARPPLRHTLLALALSTAVAAGGWFAAVLAAPASFRAPLAVGAGVAGAALVTAVTLAVRAGGAHRALRRALVEADREAEAFVGGTVPEMVARLRGGASPETVLASFPEPADEASRQVMRVLATEIGRSEASKAAATAACANAAGRMQALATSTLASLREMEHRHTEDAVLEDLLLLDHRTAQAGRLADSIAVLTGARSGRRWPKPIGMESVLRGAMGRIGGYQRVRLHSALDVAVAGHAAEAVMHALAELLDNAANFSPPTAEVHVYTEQVPTGVVVTVEDSGLVMSEAALRRAERAVASDAIDLTTLSGTRLGLAVVGVLASKHGLSVSFRPSARGGTGALLLVPQELITAHRPEGPQGAAALETGRTVRTRRLAAAPKPAELPPAPGPEAAPAERPATGPGGLPQRRRGGTLTGDRAARAAAHRTDDGEGSTHSSGNGAARPHSPAESAARFGAFRRAVQGGTQDTDRTTPPLEDDTP